MACVLQEAGDADSRAHTRSQMYVEYFIIPYACTLIRLSHFYQEFCAHSVFIMNDGWGMVDLYQGVGGGTGSGYYLIACFFCFIFICAFVFWSLMSCLFC